MVRRLQGPASPTTYESYRYTLRTLNKAFVSKPLRSIRAADVEAFLRDLTKDGTHQSQASKCQGMMFQIMRNVIEIQNIL